MILQELRALALREGLVDDPAFESKPVAWIIELDSEGGYLGLKSTRVEVAPPEGKKGKPKLQAAMHSIPRRQGRTVNDLPDFLVDKSEYVLGVEPDDKRSTAALDKRRRLFLREVEKASTATGSAMGVAVALFLKDDDARTRCIVELKQAAYAGNDLFTFAVDGKLAHQDDALRRWWAGLAVIARMAGKDRQCLLCGSFQGAARLHNNVQLPGPTGQGVPLVAFNNPSCWKYGFVDDERGKNAPICQSCMTAYVEGLRMLVHRRYKLPRTGETAIAQTTFLGGTTKTMCTVSAYWSEAKDPLMSVLDGLFSNPKQVRDLLTSPLSGKTGFLGAKFFCLVISAIKGRAIIRSMHSSTLGQLQENLEFYFSALKLENWDDTGPLSLRRLLSRLVLQKPRKDGTGVEDKLDGLPPRLAEQVYLGVLFRTRMPQIVLTAAVTRNRSEQKVPSERAALLQLFFQSRKQKEVPIVSLDESCMLPGYRLGRLFSTFEKAQTDKVRMDNPNAKLNSTLTDRFFGAASTRPGTVFPQLTRLSQTHLSKLGERGMYLRKWIGEITDGLAAFPAMLSLEEQGHFALGYYHQRQRFFRGAGDPREGTEQTELALQTQGDAA